MVLSHSCEIARDNAIKVTSIILAPVRDVSGATPREKLRELIESNFIDRAQPESRYLKYYYLEPHHKLPFQDGAIVDFSKCFSVRKNSYDFLLARKAVQLLDEARDSMALKLSLYFHRQQAPNAA
jgi:hypothetical protein